MTDNQNRLEAQEKERQRPLHRVSPHKSVKFRLSRSLWPRSLRHGLSLCILQFALITVLVTLHSPLPLNAQTETATISGLVTDESGAAMLGAEVKLKSVERGTVQNATTNNAGIYVFASVQPGPYQILVHKPGFKQVDFLGLIVNVQDHIEQNFRMQIGSVSESVTVSASDLHINTTDATVSTVVDRQFAENIPMNGRSFQTLIDLTPGVVVVPSNSQDGGQFSVNGQRPSSNYWMVDGVSANVGISAFPNPANGLGGALGSFSATGGTNSLVSVDALQEFRIQTSTYAPEFGRTPGAQISILTRSGTNQFHGTLFDYLRNDVFDAKDWFDGVSNPPLPKAKERQNDFGGTFSGPILKNRTFFFFSYEGLRLRLPRTALTTVPDASFTPGGTTDSRDNATSTLQPFLNAYPLPNPTSPEILCNPNTDPLCPSSGKTGSAAFNSTFSDPSTLDAYSLRLDQRLTDKVNAFARYSYSPSELVQRGGVGTPLSVLATSRVTLQTLTIGSTWLISPEMANETRFNYSRTAAETSISSDSFGGAVPLSTIPFPNPITTKDGIFGFSISSLKGGALEEGRVAQNLQRQVNVVDSISLRAGSHSLKFGVDYRRLSPAANGRSYAQDAFFLNMPSATSGQPRFGQISSFSPVTLLFQNLGLFAQDTWQVSRRLNVTYGLRWDVDFVPSSIDGPSIPAVTGYNLNDFSKLAIAAGTPPFRTTYGNVAPRIGLAYVLSDRQDWATVLRGGAGIFYDLVSSETGNLLGQVNPPFGAFQVVNGQFPFTPSQVAPPQIPTTGTTSQLYAFNPNLKLPYTIQWNGAVEQALGKQQMITASYVGAAGHRLLQTTSVFGPPTNPSVNGQFVDNTGTSSYQALQLQFERRLSRGLQSLLSYTWAHSIDNGSAGSAALSSNGGVPNSSNENRGASDFDIRHAFTAGLTYDIQAPHTNRLTDSILRNWSVQSFILARTAPPVEISDANFFEFDGGFSLADIRPDLVPGQPVYLFGSQYPGGKAFNPAAFTDPPTAASNDPNCPFGGCPARQGDVPRNFLRGFGAFQWDFAVHRDFPIHENFRLQFRAEMFNILNHPSFGPPSGTFGAGGFGLSSQTLGQFLNGGTSGVSNIGGGGLNPLYQIGGPRSVQFALKLMF